MRNNFKIFYDVEQIVNMAESDGAGADKLYNKLLTEGGRSIIKRLSLKTGRQTK